MKKLERQKIVDNIVDRFFLNMADTPYIECYRFSLGKKCFHGPYGIVEEPQIGVSFNIETSSIRYAKVYKNGYCLIFNGENIEKIKILSKAEIELLKNTIVNSINNKCTSHQADDPKCLDIACIKNREDYYIKREDIFDSFTKILSQLYT